MNDADRLFPQDRPTDEPKGTGRRLRPNMVGDTPREGSAGDHQALSRATPIAETAGRPTSPTPPPALSTFAVWRALVAGVAPPAARALWLWGFFVPSILMAILAATLHLSRTVQASEPLRDGSHFLPDGTLVLPPVDSPWPFDPHGPDAQDLLIHRPVAGPPQPFRSPEAAQRAAESHRRWRETIRRRSDWPDQPRSRVATYGSVLLESPDLSGSTFGLGLSGWQLAAALFDRGFPLLMSFALIMAAPLIAAAMQSPAVGLSPLAGPRLFRLLVAVSLVPPVLVALLLPAPDWGLRLVSLAVLTTLATVIVAASLASLRLHEVLRTLVLMLCLGPAIATLPSANRPLDIASIEFGPIMAAGELPGRVVLTLAAAATGCGLLWRLIWTQLRDQPRRRVQDRIDPREQLLQSEPVPTPERIPTVFGPIRQPSRLDPLPVEPPTADVRRLLTAARLRSQVGMVAPGAMLAAAAMIVLVWTVPSVANSNYQWTLGVPFLVGFSAFGVWGGEELTALLRLRPQLPRLATTVIGSRRLSHAVGGLVWRRYGWTLLVTTTFLVAMCLPALSGLGDRLATGRGVVVLLVAAALLPLPPTVILTSLRDNRIDAPLVGLVLATAGLLFWSIERTGRGPLALTAGDIAWTTAVLLFAAASWWRTARERNRWRQVEFGTVA